MAKKSNNGLLILLGLGAGFFLLSSMKAKAATPSTELPGEGETAKETSQEETQGEETSQETSQEETNLYEAQQQPQVFESAQNYQAPLNYYNTPVNPVNTSIPATTATSNTVIPVQPATEIKAEIPTVPPLANKILDKVLQNDFTASNENTGIKPVQLIDDSKPVEPEKPLVTPKPVVIPKPVVKPTVKPLPKPVKKVVNSLPAKIITAPAKLATQIIKKVVTPTTAKKVVKSLPAKIITAPAKLAVNVIKKVATPATAKKVVKSLPVKIITAPAKVAAKAVKAVGKGIKKLFKIKGFDDVIQ